MQFTCKNNPYLYEGRNIFRWTAIVFLTLIVGFCSAQPAYSADLGKIPVVCFTPQEFQDEYQSGAFEITQGSDVMIFPEGTPVKVRKLETEATNEKGKVTKGVWLVDNSGNTCLIYLDGTVKNVKR